MKTKILLKLFRPYALQIGVLALLGVAGSAFAGIGVGAIIPLFAFVAGKGVDGKISQYFTSVVDLIHLPLTPEYLLAFIFGIFVLRAFTLLLISFTRATIRYDFKYQLIRRLFDKLLTVRWQYYVNQKIGNLYTSLMKDAEECSAYLEALAKFVVSLIGAMVMIIFALLFSTRITVTALVAGVPTLLLFRVFVKRAWRVGEGLMRQEKKISQFLNEHLSGMKTVKASADLERVRHRSLRFFRIWKIFEKKKALLRSIGAFSVEPLGVLFISVTFLLTYRLEEFSIEVFVATIFLIQRAFVHLETTQSSFHQMAEVFPYLVSIADFEATIDSEQEHSASGNKEFVFSHEIEFDNVFMSYGNAAVLSGVRMKLSKGGNYAIVGASGSGKTTIADILIRLVAPTSGAVRIDGVSIEEFSIASVRRNIAYVSQDLFLLNDTINQNIRFYDEHISETHIKDAARKSNIAGFIEGLPNQYDTIIGDRGALLSVGQRQRIVLARALARRPSVLVLDEATSALDNESEKMVHDSIAALKGDTTVLMIAHRLSTVLDCDKVFVLDTGKIVEEGDPRLLLKDKSSHFYHIYHVNP